jgi:hypothetical protein
VLGLRCLERYPPQPSSSFTANMQRTQAYGRERWSVLTLGAQPSSGVLEGSQMDWRCLMVREGSAALALASPAVGHQMMRSSLLLSLDCTCACSSMLQHPWLLTMHIMECSSIQACQAGILLLQALFREQACSGKITNV